MYPERPRTLRGAMGEKRDETPFASLLGERLSSVEFVLNDYVQLRFDGPTFNAYSHPVVTVAGRTFRWGETGYRDALCERILAVVRAAWAAPEEIVIQLGEDSTIAVSNRVEDVMGAEAAEHFYAQRALGWRPGEWPKPTAPAWASVRE